MLKIHMQGAGEIIQLALHKANVGSVPNTPYFMFPPHPICQEGSLKAETEVNLELT